MSQGKFYTVRALEEKWMKNPRFRRAYEELEPEYQIARAVIKARLKRGLTQKELAKKAKTKQPVVSRLETMRGKPTLRNLERIADALGLKLDLRLVEESR